MMIPKRSTAGLLPFCMLGVSVLVLARVRAETPNATPQDSKVYVTGSKLPAFLTVDGMYILDGNEDDLVRVLELSETGWMRVQTKGGEVWVNVASLTTIMPVSKEAAARTQMRQKADFIREEAQAISDAIDAYAAKNNLPPNTPFKWQDIRPFLKANPVAYDSGGKDLSGRPFAFGASVDSHVKVDRETIKELTPAVENEDAFWGKFKP